jgi:hypothetical protein
LRQRAFRRRLTGLKICQTRTEKAAWNRARFLFLKGPEEDERLKACPMQPFQSLRGVSAL